MSTIEQFTQAMAAAGQAVPQEVHADGKIHRYSTSGARSDDAGWYVLHEDGIPAGSFGCWRAGLVQTWCAKGEDTMTHMEREAHRQRVQAMREQREADKAQRQQEAAEAAARRWDAAPAAREHPYLTAKGVKAHGLKLEGDALLAPVRDAAGTLCSLQVIDPEGSKRFQPGGRVAGGYHAMGRPTGMLVVCEGYATGASIHEATGQAVAVAFNAGNLRAVAQALHAKYPALRLVVAADDDWRTEGNPGMAKAREAAQAVGALLAVPRFAEGRGEKDTDFNDLHQRQGLAAVKACMDAAAPVATPDTGPAFPPLEDGEGEEWETPVPLPEELPPVPPFEAELLPEALRGWVVDIAERMQCPPDFVAVGAVVALSSLIGARAVVSPKERDDWRVVPNLWGLIVGRPGVMKSPALGEAMKPLHRLEAGEREQYQAAHASWELDCKVVEMAGEANERQAKAVAAKDPAKARALLEPAAKPAEPTMRRYVVNDATVEKLADLLSENPWGLLVYRDEIHGLLCSMDRQGQEGARGFYLTGYDGNQGHAVDRIGRGESYPQSPAAPRPNSFGDAAAAASNPAVTQVVTTPPSAAPLPPATVQPPRNLAEAAGIVPGNVTRVGNSYSGGNIAGNITVNGKAPGGIAARALAEASPAAAHPAMPAPTGTRIPIVQAAGIVPGGSGISSQNMAAAGGIAARVMSGQQQAQQPTGFQAPSVQHSGNSWQARNDLRNAEVSAGSIMNTRKWGGAGAENNPDVLKYKAMLANDMAMRGFQPGMDAAAMRENAGLQREGMQQAGANRRTIIQALRDKQKAAQAAKHQASQDDIARQRLGLDAGRYALAGVPSGYRPRADGQGLEAIPGGPADPSTPKDGGKLNEGQSKALAFGARMQESGRNLDALAANGVTRPGDIKSMADAVGLGWAANWSQSPEQQKVEQSQRDFVNAVLRKESGAAISNSEFDNARRQYFPQIGDDDKVIEQKRKNRELATRGMLAEVPNAQAHVQQVVGTGQGAASNPAPATSQEDWQRLPSGSTYTAPDGTIRRKK